ncbi:hypothetical protein ALTERO38_60184 [Alteromonas sp. 38]|nr:hypothetical protein ALTER154_40610 [Alteromonas sp. 154]VXC11944.1 hypothetical protein ALTERO38_60184 [Alteromonas sp. 38]
MEIQYQITAIREDERAVKKYKSQVGRTRKRHDWQNYYSFAYFCYLP